MTRRTFSFGLILLALVAGWVHGWAAPRAGRGESSAATVTVSTVEGKPIDLNPAAGVVHLLFAARWCQPCEAEIQAARRLAGSFHREGYQLVLVGIARRQTRQEFLEWARQIGFDGPLVYDEGGQLERAFGAELVPWHTLIGRGKTVLASGDDLPDKESIQRWLRR